MIFTHTHTHTSKSNVVCERERCFLIAKLTPHNNVEPIPAMIIINNITLLVLGLRELRHIYVNCMY